MQHNTTIKYLCNFRRIANRCIRNGWLDRDPFLAFKITKREVEQTALTEAELKPIAIEKFSITRLAIIQDIFLFSDYSGLAYAELTK